MAEALEFVKKDESKETDIIGFIKKFTKLKPPQAKELRKKIQELDLMQVKEDHISKIIDLLPEGEEELNKILVDINLEEDEIKKILETIKGFK